MSYFPLIIFHTMSCPLYNSKTVRDISMKLSTLIKHDKMMHCAKEPQLLLAYLWSNLPLIIFHTISCPFFNLKTVREISVKLG